ncbi:MAG: HDOD domain-containing protein [Ectothiorhodospiraceae bacterium]|nr:HDOD domain-containing protein [Ectothiorhodospiraceae bacterium]
MSDFYIARQPIYDRNLYVYAYELLYRSSEHNQAVIEDGDDATAQVLVNALIEIGLPDLVDKSLAFINLTRQHILNGLPPSLTQENVVLEVLEDVVADEELITALKKFKKQGFTIALDDFVSHESKLPMVELADIIKIDVLDQKGPALAEQVKLLRPYDIKLLAEKIETPEDFEYCKALGFDYYQGYFFCKPNIIRGERTPSSRMAIIQLLGKLQDPDLGLDELQQLISQDVSLSYRILRYINSAHFSMGQKIDSIQQAINLIGLNTIKTWVAILAMSSIDDKPYELILTALIRARMCESLSANTTISADNAFTVGLFSVLDAFIDLPMEVILAALPLADELHNALLDHQGELGQLLYLTQQYERGLWQNVSDDRFDANSLRNAYIKSIRWAGELSDSMIKEH